MKTLIIVKSTDLYFFDQFSDAYIDIVPLFSPAFSRLGIRSSRLVSSLIPFCHLYYGPWYKKIKLYSKIIVFDTCCFFDTHLLERISSKADTKDLYLYGWNIDYADNDFLKIKNKANAMKFKYYSYDKNICRKYDLFFNTIMYDPSVKIKKAKNVWDAVFVGKAKDRYSDIYKISALLRQAGIKSRIVVVGEQDVQKSNAIEVRSSYINYKDYLHLINQSQAVIDVSLDKQAGYSMRVMEALFLGKKLITTNKEVVRAPFYSSGNVLIIDIDNPDVNQVRHFFSMPYKPYSCDDQDYYSIQKWTKRFV